MSDKAPSATRAKEKQPVSQKPVEQIQEALPSALTALDVQLAAQDPRRASPAQILALQRAAGNRAVSRLLDKAAPASPGPAVQARLIVGPAEDGYEREADSVARQVMDMPGPADRGNLKSAQRPALQRQEEEEEDGEGVQAKPLASAITPLVQRRADGGFEAAPELESQLAAQKGGGSPLPDDLRASMEPRFGADFGRVRVHTGAESVQMAQELNAQAFTHGEDIHFGAGRYNPGTDAGKQLVAHELAHTIQQGAAAARGPAGRVTRTVADIIQGKGAHPLDRYDWAIRYLRSVDAGLATDVRTNTNRLIDGMRISLGKAGRGMDLARRDALRALLLCLCAFGQRSEIAEAIEYYKGRSQAEIDDAIDGWRTLPGGEGRVPAVAQALHVPLRGIITAYHQAARTGGFQAQWGGNCYQGAIEALYLAGVVSLQWIRVKQNASQQTEPHPSFAWDQNIDYSHRNYANAIEPGSILCFWKGGTVHYALSTATGQCWGHNNPAEQIVKWDPKIYGPKPGFPSGEFSIAGWLVATRRAYLSALPTATQREVDEAVHVQVASCIPNNVA